MIVQRKISSGRRTIYLRNKEERKIEVKENKNKMKRHERTGIKSNTSVSPSLCYTTSLAKVPSVIGTAYIHPESP